MSHLGKSQSLFLRARSDVFNRHDCIECCVCPETSKGANITRQPHKSFSVIFRLEIDRFFDRLGIFAGIGGLIFEL